MGHLIFTVLSVAGVLKQCERLEEVMVDPSVFIDIVADAMNQALYEQVADRIVCTPKPGESWGAELIEKRHHDETTKPIVVPTTYNFVDNIACDPQGARTAGFLG